MASTQRHWKIGERANKNDGGSFNENAGLCKIEKERYQNFATFDLIRLFDF